MRANATFADCVRILFAAFACLVAGSRANDSSEIKQRNEIRKDIANREGTIAKKLKELTDERREELLNAQRLRVEEKELEAIRNEYLKHVEKAKEVENKVLKGIRDHSRYYDVILHPMPTGGSFTSVGNNGWTLIVDWNSPVRENCLLKGGDFNLLNSDNAKPAFLLVITPVEKGEHKENPDSPEAFNAQAIAGDNYWKPVDDHHRVKRNTPYGTYAVRRSIRINSLGARHSEEVCQISPPLYPASPCLPFAFMTTLAAFHGDFIALLVPSDNAVAFKFASGGNKGDSFYKIPCNGRENFPKWLSVGGTFELSADSELPCSQKRFAAFTVYGDYLMPMEKQ